MLDAHPDMDPEVMAELQRHAASSPPIWEKTTQEARQGRLARTPAPCEGSIPTRDIVIESADRAMPVRVYDVGADDDVVILFFHGGGFVTGDLETHHGQAAELAEITGRTVVSIDYRLAPEHPFPAALHDAFDAVEWARSPRGAAELKVKTPRIAVAGVSAGANLAANASREFARRNEPMLAQLLAYPWFDATEDFESRRLFADGLGLSTRALSWYLERVLPDPDTRRSAEFSPLLDPRADRLPPTVLNIAMIDPLRDDAIAYAVLIDRAGVPASVQICPQLPHGFWGMTAHSRTAADAARELCTRFAVVLDELSPRA
ncbi:alpha/beta hydrolase [Microbacterium sp. NPDC058345]|uniref:alpha/beta hydrolase n=1 Tax=Microbacterium sp. NPDC058345 TaxID=3346455 RepID=UPI003664E516